MENFCYFELEKQNGNYYMRTSIFDRARIYSYDHTHRYSKTPSVDDDKIAQFLMRVPSYIVHWNGKVYRYW